MGDDRGRPHDRPPARTTSPLLRAKLRPPTRPEHYVRRARLLALLDHSVNAQLTVVVAPAGAGKTMLLSGWVAESAVPVGWLSLDEADRDGAQFWSGVIAAVETVAPGSGDGARVLLQRLHPLHEVAGELLNELEARPGPAGVLVIDDVHVVEGDDEVTASLGLFLQHLPAWLHVVLTARRDPHLPIDRLRARGGLCEVRLAELRFSSEEAAEMLTRLDPALSPDEIDAATARVDGWAAGLQMAALAARSSRAQQLAEAPRVDSDLLVDDYVWHEVLGAEDTDVVELMVAIAVVDRVNGSLAMALAGRPDAGELLHRAEARGLFVTRIGVAGWFALHSIVRAALLAELGRRPGNRLAEQHVRAAQWFEAAGEVPAALEHWLFADRPRDALRLLAGRHAELYDTGREATTLRTIAGIPAAVAAADFESLLDYAWCHVLVNRRRFADVVEQATWWADRTEVDDGLRARLTILQSMAATMGGEWVRGGTLARRALEDVGEEWWREPLGAFGWNMVARDVALSERWDDTCDEVRDVALALSRDPERSLSLQGIRAVGEALAGRPVDALRVAAGVRHAATVTNMTILRAELSAAEAVAHRELGDRPRAVAELQALADAPAETMLYCRILATLELVHAHIDEADLAAADAAFARAEGLIDEEGFGAGGRSWLARVGTVLGVATGDVDSARRWAEQVDDAFWSAISCARVDFAMGDRQRALTTLERAVPRCVRHEVLLGLLRARGTQDRGEASRSALVAVELAVGSGLLQCIASEGAEVVELVERAAWSAPPEWMDRLRRAAAQRRCRSVAHSAAGLAGLSERERDVLRFLPSRLTIREIADELYVSTNTLKFHLKVIYRKLGVSSRAEAAEVARRMTSIPEA